MIGFIVAYAPRNLRDLWCRWKHRGYHYGVIPMATWRCRICDDQCGIKWKPEL